MVPENQLLTRLALLQYNASSRHRPSGSRSTIELEKIPPSGTGNETQLGPRVQHI